MRASLTGLVVGAAIGSIPFAWILYRVATGRDLREEGSGNPGATNLERTPGAPPPCSMRKGGGGPLDRLADGRATAAVPAALGGVRTRVHALASGRGGKAWRRRAPFAVLRAGCRGVRFCVFVITLAVTRRVLRLGARRRGSSLRRFGLRARGRAAPRPAESVCSSRGGIARTLRGCAGVEPRAFRRVRSRGAPR
jgi:hypothetical protein